jgi:hypothetical protein
LGRARLLRAVGKVLEQRVEGGGRREAAHLVQREVGRKARRMRRELGEQQGAAALPVNAGMAG